MKIPETVQVGEGFPGPAVAATSADSANLAATAEEGAE